MSVPLPTLEAARAAGLVRTDLAVAEAKQLAALLVIADVARREAWRETRMLSAADLVDVPTQAPPFAPGVVRSWLVSRTPSGGSVLEHVTDRTQRWRDVLLPSVLTDDRYLYGIESAIEALVPEEPAPAHECKDLRPTGAASAYRGSLSANAQPTFHGFDFADTIDRGKKAVLDLHRARGRVVSMRVRAFAWPLLLVRFQSDDLHTTVVVVPDHLGGLHALSGAELAERTGERADEPDPF